MLWFEGPKSISCTASLLHNCCPFVYSSDAQPMGWHIIQTVYQPHKNSIPQMCIKVYITTQLFYYIHITVILYNVYCNARQNILDYGKMVQHYWLRAYSSLSHNVCPLKYFTVITPINFQPSLCIATWLHWLCISWTRAFPQV